MAGTFPGGVGYMGQNAHPAMQFPTQMMYAPGMAQPMSVSPQGMPYPAQQAPNPMSQVPVQQPPQVQQTPSQNAPENQQTRVAMPVSTKAVGSHIFEFRDCRYRVKAKGGEKMLLHGINGVINSGEVLAVMGPSGAGKTTLLNLLTFVNAGGEGTGSVMLNGVPMTSLLFTKYAAVVTQVDQHWTFLTCRESLQYAADLYMTGSSDEKKRRVDDLLNQMGLMTCADTKCGNQFVTGLSGGQKRRLSLALALIKNPLILFLDEPTSGLDAAAAASIMAFLKELAQKSDIMIFCTIHQPSTKVFEGFDSTMVLSNGRVAYCGPASNVQPYLQSINRPMPGNTNPAEYLLDLVNAEFTNPEDVKEVLNEWDKRETVAAPAARRELPVRGKYGSSLASQIVTLMRRHMTLVIRDPTLYTGRALIFMICCAFFAIIYIEVRHRRQEQILYRVFLFMWYIGVPSSLGVVAVYAFNTEFFALKREIKDGMFSPFSYLLSNLVLQLPLMMVLSISVILVGPYAITAFNWDNFGKMMVLLAASLWSFECCGQLFSVLFRNPLLGMLVYLCIWFASFLFAGIMVPEEDVIWPFRAFAYVLPMRWTLSSMATIEFKDRDWNGAELSATAPRGFSCPPPVPELQCYGKTGPQVLQSLENNFPSISADDHVWRDCGYLIAIALFFKICYCAMFYLKTTTMSEPKPPRAGEQLSATKMVSHQSASVGRPGP